MLKNITCCTLMTIYNFLLALYTLRNYAKLAHMQFLAARSRCTNFCSARYSIPFAICRHTVISLFAMSDICTNIDWCTNTILLLQQMKCPEQTVSIGMPCHWRNRINKASDSCRYGHACNLNLLDT